MKRISTLVLGSAGLIYGLLAVLSVYGDASVGLQMFIVAGVAAVGASIGYLVGLIAHSARTFTGRARLTHT